MEQYVQRAMAGDEEAMHVLMNAYSARLQAVAYSYVKQSHDAEDIVQQAFIHAFRALPNLREPAFFSTWLHKIVMCESLLHLKKRKRLHELERAITDELHVHMQQHDADYTALYEALHQLKQPYQTAIMLHYFYHFHITEIAQMLEKPLNTVKIHLHRGRQALHAALTANAQQRIDMKDVKRMLKEQLVTFAKAYATIPAHYELKLAEYVEEGISSFMWQGASNDESAFVRVDGNGRIDDFAKTPTKTGTRLDEKRMRRMAEAALRAQYEEAMRYFTHVTETKKEQSTVYTFRQLADGLPLPHYGCRIEVTCYGEVVLFTYTGYTTALPTLPAPVQAQQSILNMLAKSQWTLRAQHTSGTLQLLYTNEALQHVFDAQTAEVLQAVEQAPTYCALPDVTPVKRAKTLEGMFHISAHWAREEVEEREPYTIVSWRPKEWEAGEGVSYAHVIEREYTNRLRLKQHAKTGAVKSFLAMIDETGEPEWSNEACLQQAVQFLATYYEAYVPHLQLEQLDEEDADRAYFRFVLQKEGYVIDNEYFMVNISKITGAIVAFSAPELTVEALQQLVVPHVNELHVPVEQLNATLQWWHDDDEHVRAVYRIQTADGRSVQGIDATTGAIVF